MNLPWKYILFQVLAVVPILRSDESPVAPTPRVEVSTLKCDAAVVSTSGETLSSGISEAKPLRAQKLKLETTKNVSLVEPRSATIADVSAPRASGLRGVLSPRGATARAEPSSATRLSKFDIFENFPWGTVLWDMKREGQKLEREGRDAEADELFVRMVSIYVESKRKTFSKEDVKSIIQFRGEQEK